MTVTEGMVASEGRDCGLGASAAVEFAGMVEMAWKYLCGVGFLAVVIFNYVNKLPK